MRRAAQTWRHELLLLVALVGALVLLPGTPPLWLLPAALFATTPLLLNAVGILVVYRASGCLNLAQVQVGLLAAVFFESLVRGQTLLRAAHAVCETCVGAQPGRTALVVNALVAMVLSVAAAALLSWLIYLLVIARFRRAPALMSTVVTVFIAQALAGVQPKLLGAMVSRESLERGRATTTLDAVPWRVQYDILGATVQLWSIVLFAVAVVALALLGWQLRRGDWGLALRASAANADRARTLGVDTEAVARRAWAWAGLLSGLGAVLSKAATGAVTLDPHASDVAGALPQTASALILLLAVVTFARFTSLPMASLVAFVLTFVTMTVALATATVDLVQASYVVVIGLLLLLQRRAIGRPVREDTSDLMITPELPPLPRELRSVEVVRSWVRIGGIALAVLLLGGPFLLSAAGLSLMIDTFVFGMVAVSLLVLTGWGGQVSLGQFGFTAIGAWVAAVSGLPFVVAVVAAAVAGACASVIVGLPALRLRGLHLAISTLAFAVSVQAIFFNRRLLGRMLPDQLDLPSVLGVTIRDQQQYYFVVLLALVLTCVAVLGLRRSRFGRALIALRTNQAGAQAFGIDPTRLRLTAFAVSGAIAATAGALSAFHIGHLDETSFAPEMSVQAFLFTLVGGLGGLSGPLLGTAFYAVVTFFFADNALIAYAGAGLGAVLLLVVVPGGLSQLAVSTRDRLLLKLAYRLRIPVPSLMGDGGVAAGLGKAPLDEKRRPVVPSGMDPLPSYRLDGQWALDRLGSEDQTKGRIGER